MAGGEMRLRMHEGESGEASNESSARPLIFQVEKKLILTGLLVKGPAQVRSLQISKDRQLLYFQNSTAPALATELNSLWEIQLNTPVHCIPAHRYTIDLVLSSTPSSFQPLQTRLSGPSTAHIQVVQWDNGEIKGLKLQATKVKEGERWVQECMWRLWEGETGEEWGAVLREPAPSLSNAFYVCSILPSPVSAVAFEEEGGEREGAGKLNK